MCANDWETLNVSYLLSGGEGSTDDDDDEVDVVHDGGGGDSDNEPSLGGDIDDATHLRSEAGDEGDQNPNDIWPDANDDDPEGGGAPVVDDAAAAAAAAAAAQRKRRPKLSLEVFTSAASQRDSEEGATASPGREETDKDEIWKFFVDSLSKFPTIEERIEQEKLARRRGLASSQRNSFVRAEYDTQDLTAAELQKIRTAHLDGLLKTFRLWSQQVHPAGWSLVEFARRMEVLTQSSAFQAYRVQLIGKYKTANWCEEAERDPVEDGDKYMQLDANSPPPPAELACAEVPTLTAEQVALIQQRRAAAIARSKLRRIEQQS